MNRMSYRAAIALLLAASPAMAKDRVIISCEAVRQPPFTASSAKETFSGYSGRNWKYRVDEQVVSGKEATQNGNELTIWNSVVEYIVVDDISQPKTFARAYWDSYAGKVMVASYDCYVTRE